MIIYGEIYNYDELMKIDDLSTWPKKDVKTMITYYLVNVVLMPPEQIEIHLKKWMPDLL